VPGKLQLQVRGVPYLVGLIGLLAGSADLEKALLGYRPAFWAFFPAAGLVWHVLRTVNARYLETHPLIYEEEPEPAMIGFPDAG
jgi:hypothetical protein